MTRPRLATVWLGGCSGCHMSLLDLDERLPEVLAGAELVYSPLVDAKRYPDQVDLALVEGAVANEDHLALARRIRACSRVVVALGDCAVTGNVTALRNALGGAGPVLLRAFGEGSPGAAVPTDLVPALLDRVLPLHAVVAVDHFLPGCPPAPALIHAVLIELLAGRTPDLAGLLRYG